MDQLRYTLNEPAGPQLIEGLRLMCDGRGEEVSADVRGYFRRPGPLVDPATLTPDPVVRSLLGNALRRVPDGLVLVEPYENTPANREALARLTGAGDRNARGFFRRRFGADPGDLPGSGGRS